MSIPLDPASKKLLSILAQIPFESKSLVPDLEHGDLQEIDEGEAEDDKGMKNHFKSIKTTCEQLSKHVNTNEQDLRKRIAEAQFPEANTMYPRDANDYSLDSLVFLMRKSKIVETIISRAGAFYPKIKKDLPGGIKTEQIIRAGLYIFDKLGSNCLAKWPKGSTSVMTSSLSLSALLVMRFTVLHLTKAALNHGEPVTVITKELRKEPLDLLVMAVEDMLINGLRSMRHLLLLGESEITVSRRLTRERELYWQVEGGMSFREAQMMMAQLAKRAEKPTNNPALVPVSMDPGAMSRTLRMTDSNMWAVRGWEGRIIVADGEDESVAFHNALADKGSDSLLAGISTQHVMEGVVKDMEDGKERLRQVRDGLAEKGRKVVPLTINEDDINDEEDDLFLVDNSASGPHLLDHEAGDTSYLPETCSDIEYDEYLLVTKTAAGERLCQLRPVAEAMDSDSD